ncbi:pH-response regulator protein palA/rim20 [Microbotryomycetes sp. JL221]|nr:pH-response regulator protein palA/rim20 [Microbotryomycetes sp. JL221]
MWYPLFAEPTTATSSLVPVGAFTVHNPIPVASLEVERLNILYNVAATYAHKALTHKRTDDSGLKATIADLQIASGVLDQLQHLLSRRELQQSSTAQAVQIPSVGVENASLDSAFVDAVPHAQDDSAIDLTQDDVEALRDVCLAQAQEMFWLKGVMDRLKNGTIAKLAARVAELYEAAVGNASRANNNRDAGLRRGFPDTYLNHLVIKRYHFAAVAQYRRSLDDLGANRWGDELGRLQLAESFVKRAMASSKKGVADSVIRDLKSLSDTVSDNRARATKDNDLIYLEAITPPSELSSIVPAAMAKSTPPPVVVDPILYLHSRAPEGLGQPLLSSLVPFVVFQACELYSDRRDELFKTNITGLQRDLDKTLNTTLTQFGLPASIEAILQPISTPSGLLTRASEVKREGGADKLRTLMQDVRKVARINHRLMDEARAILSQEREEDSRLRAQHGTDRWIRPTSEIEGAPLQAQIDNLASILDAAAKSDGVVRTKFGTFENRFDLLSSKENNLENAIPKLENPTLPQSAHSAQGSSLRRLRELLDELEDLRMRRSRFAEEACRMRDCDDIRPRLVREADRLQSERHLATKDTTSYSDSSIELHGFEPVFEQELKKFDSICATIQENGSRQEDLLHLVKSSNDAFMQARRMDPALTARERSLQGLEEAVGMFHEVLQNLQEGLKFYSDLSKLLSDLKENCKKWAMTRSVNAQEIVQSLLAQEVHNVRISNVTEPGKWHPKGGIRFG